MGNRFFVKLVLILATVFVGFIIFAILSKDILKDYGAVVSAITTVMLLCVNVLIVTMNLQNFSFSQNPVVVINFQKTDENLGAFCFKNIGKSAAIIRSIEIDNVWLESFFHHNPSINENEKKFLRELKRTHIVLPPDEEFYIRPYFEPQRILDSQHNNNVVIKLHYESITKRKFIKVLDFDFSQFNDMIEFKV